LNNKKNDIERTISDLKVIYVKAEIDSAAEDLPELDRNASAEIGGT